MKHALPKAEKPKDDSGPQLIGYARVSDRDQIERLQLDALEKAGCLNIYHEKISARKKKRPELEKAIADLRPGDTLVVWRLDRIARNVGTLHNIVMQIKEQGAEFKSLTESFDTTTANGQFMMNIFGSLAQFESQVTQERTRAGIAAIQARGMNHGAPKKFTDEKQTKALKMWKEGATVRKIARKLKLSEGTIHKWKRALPKKAKAR